MQLRISIVKVPVNIATPTRITSRHHDKTTVAMNDTSVFLPSLHRSVCRTFPVLILVLLAMPT